MNTKLVVLIRHGETDWNAEKRWQGHSDIPLNSRGIEQAREAASALARYSLEILLSSDLQRALRTAAILGQAWGVSVFRDVRLREIHAGEAEGLHFEAAAERFGREALDAWGSVRPHTINFAFPGGESKAQGRDRAVEALVDFLTSTPAERVGVVCHGMLMRLLVNYLVPGLPEPLRIPNLKHFVLDFAPPTREWTPLEELAVLVASSREVAGGFKAEGIAATPA